MTDQCKELSIFECSEVVGAWKCGISEWAIVKKLNHPKTTIYDVIEAYKKNGLEILPLQISRPPILTERNECYLLRTLKENRQTNIKELYDNFTQTANVKVSVRIVQRYLHEQRFFGWAGVKKPFVTEVNKKNDFPGLKRERVGNKSGKI